jgi:uncharacterized protein with PQ loop repeat
MLIILIAIGASLLGSIQQLPQLYKTYTTKEVADLSFESLLLVFATCALWFLHGFIISDIPLLISGIVSMAISATLLILFVRYS